MSYLVFDFGGTLTKYAVISGQGEILYKADYEAASTLNGMLGGIEGVFAEMTQAYGALHGVGMSIPAVTDADAGLVVTEGALKYVKGVELKRIAEDRLSVPVEIENDGNCAALAEAFSGAAAEHDNAVVVVCGTGIGGALVKDRRIQKGANLHAGEFGYNTLMVDFETGALGTWSEHGSVGALVKRVNERRGSGQVLSGKEIFDLAEKGDALAIKEVDRYYLVMAMGIHSIQYSIDPQVILLGGGISRRPDFVKSVEAKLDEIYDQLGNATVRPVLKCCEHFNEANLLGAYYNLTSRMSV